MNQFILLTLQYLVSVIIDYFIILGGTVKTDRSEKTRYTDLIKQAVTKFRISLQPVSWAVAFGLLVCYDCVDVFLWMLFLE